MNLLGASMGVANIIMSYLSGLFIENTGDNKFIWLNVIVYVYATFWLRTYPNYSITKTHKTLGKNECIRIAQHFYCAECYPIMDNNFEYDQ